MLWRSACRGAAKVMRRFQLFEFLDQAWLPIPFRAAATRYLEAAYESSPYPELWAKILARVLKDCALNRIVDVGSGSGGPVKRVMEQLAKLDCCPSVTLTDRFPAVAASPFDYWPKPVDARCVPAELPGVRTLFLCLHHLAPASARSVLKDAYEKRQPICIFEATSRTPSAIAISFLIPLLVFLATPAIRPFSKFQILFTYLFPLIPMLAFWDGLVSQLRTYSITELRELSAGLTSPEFSWEYGFIQAPGVPYRTSYCIGRPTRIY
jgi:hypothetical protein